jgi:hypothetical protein
MPYGIIATRNFFEIALSHPISCKPDVARLTRLLQAKVRESVGKYSLV